VHACKRPSVKARERASVRVGPCVRVGRCSVRLWKKRGSGLHPLGGPLQENTARSSSHSCCAKRKTSCGACRRCHRPICEQPAEVHARTTRAYSRTHACTHARMHARIFTRRRSVRALAAWCCRQRAQSPLAGKPVSEQKPPRHLTQASCSALRLRLGLLCARAAGRRLRVDLPEWKVPRHDDEHDAQRVERHVRPCGRNQSCTILEMRPRAYWM